MQAGLAEPYGRFTTGSSAARRVIGYSLLGRSVQVCGHHGHSAAAPEPHHHGVHVGFVDQIDARRGLPGGLRPLRSC